ncbi:MULTISPECIES: aldo/keto reductase [Pseudomonas aeruginosa group]|uniref:aldo/keto reductase n=1 Tax=Pseudomonas aeruginosa group TaxID=136841 RepID=UPI000AFB26E2|nr:MULTISPECIES: aldo/keto reductase [Pseudomonas aeruginosa group]MDT1025155.1 aldo/keto reductase [Pseudomonas paraeruginosa]QQV49735.1 aldo/keto reductase [Pseudomonas aeruginosa]VFT20831.1 oxidoreductase [Pseudomonas aeruginosa]VTM21123.1 oxidoreductase [Pseudomonas aeruginosa]
MNMISSSLETNALYDRKPAEFGQVYVADSQRYLGKRYTPIGQSGLMTSRIALGMWQGFSDYESPAVAKEMLFCAFDNGINHFDLGNNYGRPPGTAEVFFGRVLKREFEPYRDEMIISSKAGYDLFPGPMGHGSSKKYLVGSINRSLKNLNIDYLDIFYSHRYDDRVPLEETAEALALVHGSGKALHIGISSYDDVQAARLIALLRERKVPVITNQCNFSILCNSKKTSEYFHAASPCGVSSFSPLAQGLLTGKYSRQSQPSEFRLSITDEYKTAAVFAVLEKLACLAQRHGLTLYQMSLLYVLSHTGISFGVVGVSQPRHVLDAVKVMKLKPLSEQQIAEIDLLVRDIDVTIW